MVCSEVLVWCPEPHGGATNGMNMFLLFFPMA
jgi:hypothetical protein